MGRVSEQRLDDLILIAEQRALVLAQAPQMLNVEAEELVACLRELRKRRKSRESLSELIVDCEKLTDQVASLKEENRKLLKGP